MTLMISSDLSKEVFQEENAIDGFNIAVQNGQVRLALQLLTEIISAFVEIFEMALEDEEELEDSETKEETNTATEKPIVEKEEAVAEKANTVSKNSTKKSEVQSSKKDEVEL